MPSARLDAFVPPSPSGRRAAVLGELAAAVVALPPGRRAVALDGVDGAGKTVLARELAGLVGPHREVHRASVDGFHRSAAQRHARGRTAQTFYRDQYDHAALRDRLVRPFRAGERWVRAVHDVEREVALDVEPELAAGPDAVLLVDGIFLHRAELVHLWDLDVWVEVPFEVSVPRGNARFGTVGAREADPASEENARYVGGQRLYLAEVDPARRATWVLDNTDLAAPVLTAVDATSVSRDGEAGHSGHLAP
jgi:uridine kinase